MANHAAGDVISGRYRLDAVLGRGGSAVTWRGTDLGTQAPVAIKELAIRAVEQWRAVELFEREARVLRNLDHPHIPAYLDFIAPSAEDEAFVLVQGLAPGKSLADLVTSGWRATEADARDIARQVLTTLEYLHGFSPPVVHRDLKPQNLIRSDDGNIMVVDFGAVRDTLAAETDGLSVAGTFGYMAPEQFAGRATPASDLYSLGAALVHVLSHRAPAELPQRELRLDFRPFVQVSDGFARFLEGLLEPAPERRFSSAAVALAALDRPPPAPSARRPSFSPRARITFDGDRLILDAKTGAAVSTNLMRLGFSVAWLSFVTFWTTTAISMGGPIIFPIFSIPFWIVGVTMFGGALRGLVGRSHFELSANGALVERRLIVRTGHSEVPLADIVDIESEGRGRVVLQTQHKSELIANLPGGDEATKLTDRLREHLATLRPVP